MSDPKDPNPLRDRLEALLKRAREISAEIERRVEAVTGETGPPEKAGAAAADAEVRQTPSSEAPGAEAAAPGPPDLAAAKEAMEVATEAVAVTAEAAAVTAEALTAIANDTAMTATPVPPVEPEAPTTTGPRGAMVVPDAGAAAAPTATPLAKAESKTPPEEPPDDTSNTPPTSEP